MSEFTVFLSVLFGSVIITAIGLIISERFKCIYYENLIITATGFYEGSFTEKPTAFTYKGKAFTVTTSYKAYNDNPNMYSRTISINKIEIYSVYAIGYDLMKKRVLTINKSVNLKQAMEIIKYARKVHLEDNREKFEIDEKNFY